MVVPRQITRLDVQGFKALRDVSVDLAPFTVVVGGNASGKSTMLDAIDLLFDSLHTEPARHRLLTPDPTTRLRAWTACLSPAAADEGITCRAHFGPEAPLALGVRLQALRGAQTSVEIASHASGLAEAQVGSDDADAWTPHGEARELRQAARAQVGSSLRLQLDPRRLAEPSEILGEAPRLAEDGRGLASVLRDVRDRTEESFDAIVDAVGKVVPAVAKLRVRVDRADIANGGGSVRTAPCDWLDARLDQGGWCPASELSEGTLATISILTALHGEGAPQVLLLDDIDRGLHPRAQRELAGLLRTLIEQRPGLQIVCTTHSPYLVDCFSLEEVVVLALDDKRQTHAKRLSDHPDARKWKTLMEAGELWSSVGEDWVLGT